jgi:DNA-nicking Smr family endonuclease
MGKKGRARHQRRLRAAELKLGVDPVVPDDPELEMNERQIVEMFQEVLPVDLIHDVLAASQPQDDLIELLSRLTASEQVGERKSDPDLDCKELEEHRDFLIGYDPFQDALLALQLTFPQKDIALLAEIVLQCDNDVGMAAAVIWSGQILDSAKSKFELIMEEQLRESRMKAQDRQAPYLKAVVSKPDVEPVEFDFGDVEDEGSLWKQLIRAAEDCPVESAREASQKAYDKRNELYRRAQAEFAAKRPEVAMELLERAKSFLPEIKRESFVALASIFRKNNHDFLHGGTVMDLHGLYVAEAKLILDISIPVKKREGHSRLWIITGVGNHSKRGVSKLYPAVYSFLKTQGFAFEVPRVGAIRVSLT